jgi:hypothetical protein
MAGSLPSCQVAFLQADTGADRILSAVEVRETATQSLLSGDRIERQSARRWAFL